LWKQFTARLREIVYVRILTAFGTRPDAIKMVPILRRLADARGIDSRVCITATPPDARSGI